MENKKLKKGLKKFIWIALLLAVATTGVFTFISQNVEKELVHQIEVNENWKQYSSEDKRFRVEFPKSPVKDSKEIAIPSANQSLNYEEVRAEESQVVYAVSYIDFPRKWRMVGANTLLKKSLALLVEHEAQGQQLVSQEQTTHNGDPAINYLMKRGEHEVVGKIILSGTTLYRLTATYKPTLADQVQQEQFFSSFSLS